MRENKKTAGILLYKKVNDEWKYFLVHPGGPFWKYKQLYSWSIPKGGVEDEEDLLTAAKREFREETGHLLEFDDDYIQLQTVKLKSGKRIHAFAYHKNVDIVSVKSILFDMEYPKDSGIIHSYPEVDDCGWFNQEECSRLMNTTQYNFIIEMENILKNL